jgi:pyruvate/2-oxoacid:ferredoxin oxidoreductase beta subunit
MGVTYARLAVQTRYFPLFEYHQGKFIISSPTKNIKEPKDIKEFAQGQKRFRHFGPQDYANLSEYAVKRWAFLQSLAANSK